MKSVIMKSIIGASRGGILGLHTQIVEKQNEALTNYIQELKDVREIFEVRFPEKVEPCHEHADTYVLKLFGKLIQANKDDPPLLESHPKIAGRIWWMKSLFHRIKKPMVELKKDEEVMITDPAQQALQDYLKLAHEMRAYGDQLYAEWDENAVNALPANLKDNVLVSVPATEEDLGRNYTVCKNKNIYKVNVPEGILEIIQEVQLLEEMGGFPIAESLRTVSLQQSQYTANILTLEAVVEKYYKLRLELRPSEAQLCDKLFQEMDKHFEQGATHWNWAALALADYANTLSDAVGHFGGVVSQINKIGRDVRFRVLEMKNVVLFKEPPYKTASYDLPIFDCWDYFQYWEKHRAKIWEKLLLHYRGLPPLFVKLETLTQNSSTGKHASFHHYFARWEKLIFQYMGKFVIRSLYVYEKRLLENEPLFYVEAVLHAREIRLNPPPHEIFNLVLKGARDCVEGTQEFVRWMRASCTESPPVPQGGGQPPFIYSFYLEIGRIPRMLQMFLKIQENIQSILSDIWIHLKKFRKFKNLIRFSKERTVKEFASMQPPVGSYDEKLDFYSRIEKRITEISTYKVFGCIKLHVQPLMSAICRHAREWVFKLGAALHANSRELIKELDLIVSEYDRDVHVLPKNVDEMKHIFLTIQAIKDATIYVEGLYRDLLKRYDVLKLYEIEFPQQDIDRLEEIWCRWQMLWLHEVKVVDKQMQPLKMKFTKITKDEGGIFRELVKDFAKSYFDEGPGSVGADLDRGVDLVEEFREKYKIIEQKRVAMANSEKVFGLECSLYPELLAVLKDLDTISILFSIYQSQKEARASWGQVLWTELNAQFLTDGIEFYLQELRKLPKSVRSSEVGKQLEAAMKEFRRSIPVFMDLRNESTLERVTLYDRNGVRFDFDPDRLTPGDLFLMEIRFDEEQRS